MTSNLKRDYFWNTLGVLFQNFISPILVIVVTRINGINDSGIFSFAFSVAIIFWAISMWGGRTYQVSDTKALFKAQSYIVMRVVLAVAVLVIATVFCVVNNYDATKSGIILALVLLKAFESIADAIYGVLQTNDRLYIAGKSLLYKSVFGTILFIVIDALTHNILLGCMGIAASTVAIIAVYDIPRAAQLQSISIKKDRLESYLKESVIIMRRTLAVCIVSFLAALSLNIPRYFLDLQHPEEIGYFGILAMPVTLVVLLMTFVLQPNIVGLARHLKDKKVSNFIGTVKKIILTTTVVGVLVVIGVYAVGVELLTFVFGVDFGGYKAALMIITLGAISSALVAIFINMLTIMRKLTVQVYVLLFTNTGLTIFYLLFIKEARLEQSVTLFALTSTIQAIAFAIIYVAEVRRLRREKA